jgi:hypothetical protein
VTRVRLLLLAGLAGASVPLSWLAACSGETKVPPPVPKVHQREAVDIGVRTVAANATFALSDPAPEGFPDLRAVGNPVIRLDLAPGKATLPVVDAPGSLAELGDEFVLEHKEMANPRGAPRKLKDRKSVV